MVNSRSYFCFCFPSSRIDFQHCKYVKDKEKPNLSGRGLAIAGFIISIVLTIMPLLLILLIGGIAYFGVIDPASFVPETCEVRGFMCEDYTIIGENTVRISISSPNPVASATLELEENACTPMVVDWQSGETKEFTCPISIEGDAYIKDMVMTYDFGEGFGAQISSGKLTGQTS